MWIKVYGRSVCDETKWCLFLMYVFIMAIGIYVYHNVSEFWTQYSIEQEQARKKKAVAKPNTEPPPSDEWTKMD